ncbi:MAG: transposase [Opitutaceae bacterium]|jgi:REP element-mobilizing transposase RayT|nr:transposase [Opitutaceae bacterium]
MTPSPQTRHPVRQTDNLRRGRISQPDARYFVTFVTQDRTPWLAAPESARTALRILRTGHDASDWTLEIATCMPDHLHVLFSLSGPRLTIGQCVARWKFQIRQATNPANQWQRNFWEHRLYPDEDHERYALYIFLNPWRAGLLPLAEAWPHTWMPTPWRFRFTQHLTPGATPPAEWLRDYESRFGMIHTRSRASQAKPLP